MKSFSSPSAHKKHQTKKQKTHTTRIYRKREKEIQHLLSGINTHNEEPEIESLRFFHSVDNKSPTKSTEFPHQNCTSDEESDHKSSLDAVTETSTTTFVQIDWEEPLILPQLLRYRHYFDESLLSRPSDKLSRLTDITLSSWTIRMLNRFPDHERTDSLIAQLDEPTNYVFDETLYHSDCARFFKSVFLEPTAATVACISLPQRRCLKLSFKTLRFTQHPQLLEEHRLTHDLEDLYDSYTEHIRSQACAKLREELLIARNTCAELLKAAQNQLATAAQVKRQLHLTQQLRRRYYAEATMERSELQLLLGQWAKLKDLRKQQQFQCTRFQLSLRVTQPTDLKIAYDSWKSQFEADLAEVYREHLEEYYCQQRLWNEQEHEPDTIRKKPPRKPQFEKIMSNLRAQYECAFKDPEEPQVDILRVHANQTTVHSGPIPGVEHLSKGHNYFIKLYFDGRFVAQTRTYRLEPDLKLHMHECIGVLLDRTPPTRIHIWLYEKSMMTPNNRRIAQIHVPLTMDSYYNNTVDCQQKLSFMITSESRASGKLAGDLFLHIDYLHENGQYIDMDDIQPLPKTLRQTLLPAKWPVRQSKPNISSQNMPKPPDGIHRKSSNKRMGSGGPIFAEQLLRFCSIETLMTNKRFQLLHSRHQQRNMHTQQMRFVPSLEHEIPDDCVLKPSESKVLDLGSCWDPIDLHKYRGRKFLQLLYDTIRSHSAQRARALQTPQPLLMLYGEEQIGWSTLWRAICSWCSKQQLPRSLSSLDWRSQQSGQESDSFKVLLHVVRATGIPVRSNHIFNVENRQRSSSSGGDISTNLFVSQTLMYSNVRPFITLSYGPRLCRSSTAEGSNPTWNEQLQLLLNGRPIDLREDLKITLFDELIEQEYIDEAGIYQRVQCNWLGEYRVPISGLFASKKFEGCIEMNMPKVLVGYKRPLIDSVTNMAAEHYPEFKESVHLWFYLSIEPNEEIPLVQTNSLACAELPELQQYLQEQRIQLQPQLQLTRSRYIEPLVCTAQGKRVCLTRLLEPIPLPITASDNVMQSVCRFVSLISQQRTYDACQGLQGVWLDNETLLDSTWGSIKDLGVLLCNFLLTIGVQCWLVLGMACPFGESAFVLYRQSDNGEFLLLSPATGKRYNTKDVFCPLNRVDCMLTPQNIYYNIQAEIRVSMTNFDVNDSNCWLPLFNKRQMVPTGGVQKTDYVYKHSYEVAQLQKHIERKIMKKITAWRSTHKTIWNRAFQPRLLGILQEMEKLATFTSGQYDEPAFSDELEREFPNYRLYGFTLNFPYSNLSAISDRIRTTCIHYNNNTDVEFCVAVHINSYSNDVLSVWLFIISIVPMVL